jgi:hypothetical protein
MTKLYVYIIISQNRLVITKKEYDDSDHLRLTTLESYNEAMLMNTAKTLCSGYILGRNINIDVVNDIDEFKL